MVNKMAIINPLIPTQYLHAPFNHVIEKKSRELAYLNMNWFSYEKRGLNC